MDDQIAVVRLEAVIEVDDPADEGRREDADGAEIEEIETLRFARVVERGIVAEMRIAVNDPVTAEGQPPRSEQAGGEAVADVERMVLEGEEPPALEPRHGEEPARRQLGQDLRHADAVLALEQFAVERHVTPLTLVVELLSQPGGKLDFDLRRVDGPVEPAMQRQQELQLREIGLDRRIHVRILELAGEESSCVVARPVHLSERSGGRRLGLEARELCLPVGAELGRHAPPHERPTHGGRLRLQRRKLLRIFRRQDVGDRRQELRDFHERALQGAQRLAEEPRLAGGIRLRR